MIKVNAKIKLFKDGGGRKTPFTSGYRPLFSFISDMKTSGKIILKDRMEFFPGDEGMVEIIFLDKNYLAIVLVWGLSSLLEKDMRLWERERY